MSTLILVCGLLAPEDRPTPPPLSARLSLSKHPSFRRISAQRAADRLSSRWRSALGKLRVVHGLEAAAKERGAEYGATTRYELMQGA